MTMDDDERELISLRSKQQTAANIGAVAVAMENLARTIALGVIAEHGSAEDRENALKTLWKWVSSLPEE